MTPAWQAIEGEDKREIYVGENTGGTARNFICPFRTPEFPLSIPHRLLPTLRYILTTN